jgi:hypothetical protein
MQTPSWQLLPFAAHPAPAANGSPVPVFMNRAALGSLLVQVISFSTFVE